MRKTATRIREEIKALSVAGLGGDERRLPETKPPKIPTEEKQEWLAKSSDTYPYPPPSNALKSSVASTLAPPAQTWARIAGDGQTLLPMKIDRSLFIPQAVVAN